MKKDDAVTLQHLNDEESSFSISRRQFLKAVGGGIAVYFFCGDLEAQQRGRQPLPTDFNAFLRIGADGRVTCFTGKIEMGQGVVTSLAQMLAEELDVPLNSVDMVMGDTDRCPWDMGTFGSMSTRFFGPPLRDAAAEARAILMGLAAEALRVKEDQLTVKGGVVMEKARTDHRITYAELVKGKMIEKHLDQKPQPKRFSEFSVSGKPTDRTDGLAKVNGKALYAGDIRVPGMLYAKILRPPAHGAKLKNLDTSAVDGIKEVKVVRDGDLVAVLHPSPDGAGEALAKIKAQYDVPEPKVDEKTIFDHLLKVAPPGQTVSEKGNIQEGEKAASAKFEATYLNSYVAHAQIETHTALVQIEPDKVTVWASTQTPFSAKEEVARVLGIPSQKVRVITPFVGGGFGGKSFNLQAVEAARLAKLVGRPVQVAWSRKEAFFNDTFRPAAVVKIRSGASPANQIVFWDYDVYFAGSRGAEQFYDIPHHKEISRGVRSEGAEAPNGATGAHPFGTGPWRAPGNNTNTFARESHIDIMAAKLGVDPVEFRMKNLKNPRMERVLKAAADKFGWKALRLPSRRGVGVSCAVDAGAYVAAMAEVEVEAKTGNIRVKRIVCAQEMGFVINPTGATMQMEGCLTMGLGYALSEEIRFKGGQILDENFDTYDIPRFSRLPKIETVLVEARDLPPQGGGEPPIVCVGAVVANAVFDATGARLFELPMTPDRIKKAMGKT